MPSKKRKQPETPMATPMETKQDINDLRKELMLKQKELNEEEKEFNSLLSSLNDKLKQAEFDLLHGDYLVKEHCNELRRQVQSAKETTMLKIEEITNDLFTKIKTFESDSLDAISKVDKQQINAKLSEIKNEAEKWSTCSNKSIKDPELCDDLRNSVSKIAIERENINQLLFNCKFLEFKPIEIELINIGTLTTVSVDSFDYKIDISKHIQELEQSFNFYHIDEFREYIQVKPLFICRYSSIFSNGDLLLAGVISDSAHSDRFNCSVILIFDLEKNKLKDIKKNSLVKFDQIESCSDKICVSFHSISDISMDSDHELDLKNDNFGNDLPNEEKDFESIKYIVFNQKLEELHRIKCNQLNNCNLISANDTYLIFMKSLEQKKEYENCSFFFYSWSLQFVRAIGQFKDIERPFSNNKICFGYFFNRIYCVYQDSNVYHLKAFDDKTGEIVKVLQLGFLNHLYYDNFSFDCNNNFVLFNSGEDKKIEIKYFNSNGDLFLKSKFQNCNSIYSFHKSQSRNVSYFDKDARFLFYQKKLDLSKYTIKSAF